jgi:replicative DNA helicase
MAETWLDVTSQAAASATHERMSNPVPVVPTGLGAIDRAMLSWGQARGIPRGTYMIVGGASNVGKTQWGLQMARNAANAGEKAGVVSLDMKEKDALLRIHQALVDKSEIPAEDWRPDRWRPAYEARLRDGLVRWRKSITGDLGIYAVPVGDLSWVSASITKGIEAGVTFFVIDHLQKIRVQGVNGPADRAELISETLDNFCDEYGVTIVGLSQLNREASRDRDRKPIMQDLLGGTSLESNAQVVIMLDHSRYERDETRHHIGRTWVMLDKNQMGPKNFEVAVEVNHATLEYREALPDEMRDWPGAIDDAPRRRR